MRIRHILHNVGSKKKTVTERIQTGIPWVEMGENERALVSLTGEDRSIELQFSKVQWEILNRRVNAAFAGKDPNGPFAKRYEGINDAET